MSTPTTSREFLYRSGAFERTGLHGPQRTEGMFTSDLCPGRLHAGSAWAFFLSRSSGGEESPPFRGLDGRLRKQGLLSFSRPE